MKTVKYIVYALAAALAFAACASEKEYTPTPAPIGDEVTIVPITELVSLTDTADVLNYFDITLIRVKKDKAVLVQVDSEADEMFSIPTSVIFPAGKDTTVIRVTFDRADLVSQKRYDFTVSISGEAVSKYAISTISFQAGDVLPLKWHKWMKGVLTEGWWNEVEEEYMYYAILNSTPEARALFESLLGESDPITAFISAWTPAEGEAFDLYCYIESTFDTSGEVDPIDYYFTWHLADNSISIAPQWMGYCYLLDAAHYAMEAAGWDEAKAIAWAKGAGYALPYYDGNGGFYLADWFMTDVAGGKGYQFGGTPDLFIADGFVRNVNYNEYYYKDLAVGSVTSEGLDDAWDDQVLKFNEYPDNSGKTIYYLPDYFGAGKGLAFAGPHVGEIVDGAPIQAVANEQATGMQYGGKDLYAVVIGGSVSVSDDATVFTIQVQYETMAPSEDDPNKLVVYGTLPIVNEVFTVSEKATYYGSYQAEPVENKNDFFGVYDGVATYYTAAGFVEKDITVTIEEGGWSSDRREQYVLISGLSAYAQASIGSDTIEALYEDGFIKISAQTFFLPYVYAGKYYCLVDPYSTTDGTTGDIICGVYTDSKTKAQKLIFVGNENTSDCLNFYLAKSNGALAADIDYVMDISLDYTGHEPLVEDEEEEAVTHEIAPSRISKPANLAPKSEYKVKRSGKKAQRSFALSFSEGKSFELKSFGL